MSEPAGRPKLSKWGEAALRRARVPDQREQPASDDGGPDAVEERAAPPVVELAARATAGAAPGRRLRATTADQVPMRRLRWLWDDRVLLANLTLLAGREGIGKSTLAVDVAARVTRGTLTGELHGQPRAVIYVHTEDARDVTVVPRLTAAGADLSRVVFIDAVTTDGDDEAEGPLVFPLDLADLAAEITEHDAALLVLDAATSVIDHRLDGNKDRDMRRALEPIARLGQRTDCAVLGIVHFGKRDSTDSGKLILGSIGWSQVARSVLSVARDDDTEELIVTTTKANLSPGDTRSLRARIAPATVDTAEGPTSVGRTEWLGETDTRAQDLLGDDAEQRSQREEARAWLTAYMIDHDGQARAAEVQPAARKDGLSEATLRRARTDLKITTRKSSAGGWVWDWPGGPASGREGVT